MEFLQTILGPDVNTALLIILNLIIIESLLSVDNAAVLATMVMDLPEHQRKKALKYGILGAYIFRGICLLLAAWLIKIWWLKPLGGLYLLYLAYNYFSSKKTQSKEDDLLEKKEKGLYQKVLKWIGPFWATIAMVEVMDLAFSLDNVFAAVAYVENIPEPYNIRLVIIGVFIGILAMRFVAQTFVKLMEKYPFLETAAFLVIGVLGLKLVSAIFTHQFPELAISKWLDSEHTDLLFSFLTMGIFFIPIITCILFNFPKKNEKIK